MELSIDKIKSVLAIKNNDGNAETLTGEVAFQDRKALQSIVDSVERGDGVTRSNTKWRRCEYVIISSTDPKHDYPIQNCLKGWKALAGSHGDQVLILEVANKTWEIYNHNSELIGGNAEFESLINKILNSAKITEEKQASPTNLKPYIDLLIESQNLVLTGAPGTGKTFLAKAIAEEMGAETEFVQFHPSYDYTDFIEGLRPVKKGSSDIAFERMDGVFKEFCKKALPVDVVFDAKYSSLASDIEKGLVNIGTDTKSIVAKDGLIRVKSNDNRPAAEEKKAVTEEKLKALYSYFIAHPERWKSESTREGFNTIIAKSPIRSKYVDYYAKPIVEELLRRSQGEQINVDENKKFVFIIDEINRGEFSKIFGELFYAIDPGYRGIKGKVKTQYQNLIKFDDVFYSGFYVPENVYIIATMNDIDRSVDNMDFAIRRRFAWREVTATESAVNMGLSDLVKDKMNALNKALKKNGLSEAYYIGGAYFRKLKGTDFNSLWNFHLKGIVTEYFRGEPDADERVKDVEAAYMEAQTSE